VYRDQHLDHRRRRSLKEAKTAEEIMAALEQKPSDAVMSSYCTVKVYYGLGTCGYV
jgi:hypothetical protein